MVEVHLYDLGILIEETSFRVVPHIDCICLRSPKLPPSTDHFRRRNTEDVHPHPPISFFALHFHDFLERLQKDQFGTNVIVWLLAEFKLLFVCRVNQVTQIRRFFNSPLILSRRDVRAIAPEVRNDESSRLVSFTVLVRRQRSHQLQVVLPIRLFPRWQSGVRFEILNADLRGLNGK